jgi:hypothetical protein
MRQLHPYHDARSIGVLHRLRAGARQIQDGEAEMTERHGAIGGRSDPGSIGAVMRNRVAHGDQ